MAKQIARLLKATIQDTSDLKQIAKELARKGRGGDSMLAHITPKEAGILKAAGGSGTINPDTGLMEFYDGEGIDLMQWGGGQFADTSPLNYGFDAPATSEFGGEPARSAMREASYQFTPSAAAPAAAAPATPAAAPVSPGGVPSYMDVTSPEYAAAMRGYYAPQDRGRDVFGAAVPVPPVSGSYAVSSVPPPAPPKSTFERISDRLTSPETVEKLGLAGIGAIPGIYQSIQAQKQGQEAKAQMQKLAKPYRQQADQLIAQAQRGELTAPGQQQIQAMQARLAQAAATTGGVGVAQANAQLEAFRQQLLQNQYDYGLKLSNISDNIATGAIKAGLQADQYVNELTGRYFNNAFNMATSAQPTAQSPRG